MPKFDGAAFGNEIVAQVRKFVTESHAPLLKEIETLRSELAAVKSVDHGPAIAQAVGDILVLRLNDTATEVETRVRAALPDVGALVSDAVAALPVAPTFDEIKSVVVDLAQPIIADMVVELGKSIPVPVDGKDGKDADPIDMVLLGEQIKQVATEIIATIPVPQDGKDGKDGVNGKDADPLDGEAILVQLRGMVAEAVTTIPVPVDGRGIKHLATDDKGHLLITLTDDTLLDVGKIVGTDGKDADAEALFQLIDDTFKAIPAPKDGVGIADVNIDDAGKLVVKLTDGVEKTVGQVVGAPGKDADLAPAMQMLGETLAAIPTPKDGVGLFKFELESDGQFVIHTTDGKRHEVGVIKGQDGIVDPNLVESLVTDKVQAAVKALPAPVAGVGIENVELSGDEEGALIVTLTDGKQLDLGRITGKDGVSIDPEWVAGLVSDKVFEAVKEIPVPVNGKDGRGIKSLQIAENGQLQVEWSDTEGVVDSLGFVIGQPGKDVDVGEIKTWITDEITARVKSIPEPVGIEDIVREEDGTVLVKLTSGDIKNLGQIVNGVDGQDADLTPVNEYLAEVAKGFEEIKEGYADAIAAIPTPKDGVGIQELNVADNVLVIKLSDGETEVRHELPTIDFDAVVTKAVSQIPVPRDGVDGKDGVGVAGAIIDRDGELIVTNTLGTPFKLGQVVGKDVDMAEVMTTITKAVEALPKPKDGVDGIGFDNMDILFDEETKELVVSGEYGDRAKQWKLFVPVLVDRGVFDEKHGRYLKGDGVTYGGSFWIAQKETDARPGIDDNWRLSVKKGKDGKDGKIPEPPKPVQLNGKA